MDEELDIMREEFALWEAFTNPFWSKKQQETPKPPDKKSKKDKVSWPPDMIRGG